MNLEGVATILEQAGVGKIGKSIFAHFMPTEAAGILLRDPFGGSLIDHELPGLRKTSFMLIVRHKEHKVGKKLIEDAMRALTLEGVTAGGMQINYMRPRHDPLVYQPSPGNNLEFTTNIDCSYVIL